MANDVIINVKANTAQAQSALSAINKSWVGVNSALDLGRKAAQFLGDAYNALVGDTQEYAQAVLKMTRISGQSAEMTSRMIELTDDFGIAQETLAVAMRSATTKGIAFTTDNLAALSDEYVKLKPGIEQAQFAAENFGSRAGPEMQKLLEKGSKAIRDQAASIDEHMLMTEEDLKASEDLRIAQDNLSDSVTALSRQLGKELIPQLSKAADAAYLLMTWNEKLSDATATHNQELIKSKAPYKDYIEEMTRAAKETGYFVDAQMDGVHVYRLTTAGMVEVENTLGILSRSEYEAAKEARNVTAEMQFMQTYGPGAADDIRAVSDAAIEAGQKLRDDLAQGFREVQAANESWAKGAGGDIATMLEQSDLKAGEYNQALLALDQVMGTNHYTAKLQNDAMQKIVDQYKKTGDVDAFKESLLRLKNGGFQPMTDSIITARVQLEELIAKMHEIDGQTATGYVNIISGSGGATMTEPYTRQTGTSNPGNLPGFGGLATGGTAYANTPYIVGEEGPEVFVPGRTGTVIPNDRISAGVTINTLNVTLPGVTNASQLMAELGRLANNARNAGRAYQGA